MKNKNSWRLTLAAAALWLIVGATAEAMAQGPSSGGPAPGTPVAEVPLDGGASLLLAAGIGLGLKRLRNRSKT